MAFISGILFLPGWNPLIALMAGTILGGTSSEIIIPLVRQSTAADSTKTLLSLESSLTDALCVIATIAIAQIVMAQNIEWQGITQSLFAAFSVATVIGFMAALLWIKILRDFGSAKPFSYILSVGILFGIYVLTEFAGGNGPFSALVFGLVLGNAREITRMLHLKEYAADSTVSGFQLEISLFIRTFFFVFIGIIFSLNSLSVESIGLALALTLGLLIARTIGAKMATPLMPEIRNDRKLISTAMARGLAAAVLATYPLSNGLSHLPNVGRIAELTFLVILFSNLISSAGLFVYEKHQPKNHSSTQPEEGLTPIMLPANPKAPAESP